MDRLVNNRQLLEPIGNIPPAGAENDIMPCWTIALWLRNLNQMASGNPGAIHHVARTKDIQKQRSMNRCQPSTSSSPAPYDSSRYLIYDKCMKKSPMNADQSPSYSMALNTIMAFYLLYTALIFIRDCVIYGKPIRMLSAYDVIPTVTSIVITYIFYLILLKFEKKKLSLRILIIFTLAMPFSALIAITNFYFLNIRNFLNIERLDLHLKINPIDHDVLINIAENSINNYFFISSLATLYLAFSYAHGLKESERHANELEISARQAELRSLRYQVNPDFLFSTLNTISSLISKNQFDKAEAAIMLLSGFYRSSLHNNISDYIDLDREIYLGNSYLELESLRFSGRISMNFDIPRELLGARVPNFILLSILEKAIRNNNASHSSEINIIVSARWHENRIYISVSVNYDKSINNTLDNVSEFYDGSINSEWDFVDLFNSNSFIKDIQCHSEGFLVELMLPLDYL